MLREYSRGHNRLLSDVARDVAVRAPAAAELRAGRDAAATLAEAD